MKCRRKRIAGRSKDKTIVRPNRLMQDFIVPSKQSWYGIGILLRELGTAFDIGKEKGDGARRKISHHF
jgi:hypothetical protein